MVKWSVLIAGIGVRAVEAKDIDGAYAAAMAAYGCRLEDILAVFPCWQGERRFINQPVKTRRY